MADPAPDTAEKHTGITVDVTGAQAGQRIEINLAVNSPTTAKVAWSTGPSFANAAGMQLSASGNALPLAQFNVTKNTLIFQTAAGGGGGGAIAFSLKLYLAGSADLATFALGSETDPGVTVTAATSGSLPQTINTGTILNWPSD